MPTCRACRHTNGQIVLDLGEQPACDYFPRGDDPGPDPVYPLQMWLCARCGLAQLAADPTVPREPRATEPAALVAQAADAVGRAAVAGLLPVGARVAEYGSPHGGSWLPLLRDRGLVPVANGEPADVVVDCFGLMHAADQHGALAGRLARLGAGGVLLVQYHSLATIIKHGQWNALRHGHYAYYSTESLLAMLAAQAFRPLTAWRFDLYGGTVLLAAARDAEVSAAASTTPDRDGIVADLLAEDARVGAADPDALRGLADRARATAAGLADWLAAERDAGRRVIGYGAASRAVALLCMAGVDRRSLPAIADASPAKHGLRMPGTGIPVVSPAQMSASPPDSVLLFVSDLRSEVKAAFPEIEAAGGRWLDADSFTRVRG
ncbi:MAG TPA: class I SAM-dependent methyltransferase [Streptosporangiaceae bacterium]|nr:class I SAM-dependent methyltransferase [Streptosporangiaceae bacterium]